MESSSSRHDCGVLLKPSCILGLSSNMSAFSRCCFLVYAHHLILFEPQPRGRLFKARFVLAEMCCKSECRLGLRRAGLVESSI